ncbi:MAG: hypothetical protein R3A12_12710 [Ignavibacteria bacterium]
MKEAGLKACGKTIPIYIIKLQEMIHYRWFRRISALISAISQRSCIAHNKKVSGLKSGTTYVVYCPMAFDRKGAYWLSKDKEIMNPYFGENA